MTKRIKRKSKDVTSINREDLLKILNLIKPSLSSQNFVPILLNFCFTGNTVYAFDGVQCAGINYKLKDKFSISGDLLIKLLQSYNTKQLLIDVSDSVTNINIGKSKLKLSCLSEKEFTFDFPKLLKQSLFKVTEDFINGISKCLVSVNDNQLIENQNGVFLDLSGRTQYLYSTNNSCISRYKLKRIVSKEKIKILIPKLFCEQLISLFKEYKEGEFYLNKDFIYVKWKDAFLYSKIKTDVDFLDFSSVISSCIKNNYVMQDIPENITNILDRSIMFSGSEIDTVIKFESDTKKIKCSTDSNHGNIEDYIEFKDSIEKFTVRYDANSLKNCVNNISRMGFVTTDDSNILIGEDDNYLMLLSSFSEGE